MRVCIIPARGGSKRIPNKNRREFCGIPMIVRSVTTALEARCFDRVVVSTDDTAIATLAASAGAEIPFMRPEALANDHTPTVPVIRHAIDNLNGSDNLVSLVCCLYATAPFVRPEDLRDACARLEAAPNSYVFPITTFAFPIQRALLRSADGRIRMMYPECFSARSQDLPETWHDAGQFYVAKASTWQARAAVFEGETVGIPVPRHRVQDIDTPEDWDLAERLFLADRAR